MSTPRTLLPAAPAPSLDDQHKRYLLSVAGYANIELTAPDWPSAWDVVANSIRLRVLEWGRDNRDTVIFLHGGSLTSHTWDLACASLSAEYRCVAIDLRGHGDSEWPADADYRLEAIAADIEGVIDVMADTAPILVGMSLGGLAAIHVAARRNDTIRGLVLVDIGPKQSSAGVEEIQRFSELPHVSPSFDEFVERSMAFNPRRRPELLRRSLLNNVRQLPDGTWTWKWDKRRLDQDWRDTAEVAETGLWAAIRQVTCPALVIRGAESNILSEPDAQALRASFSDGDLALVESAGHTVQGDNPAGFIRVLRSFLSRLTSDASSL